MSKVPNFPPLTGINDLAVRAVLQAIINNLRTLNGEVGNEAAVRENQLQDKVVQIVKGMK